MRTEARVAAETGLASSPSASRSRIPPWLADDGGAIMVIAIFMSALVVGAIWYTLGLGEAMIYSEQMRAAADATAFDAATLHALGMNMVSMLNVTMAALLAILLAATVFLLICIGITVLSIACAALTLGLCSGATDGLIAFDQKVWQFCTTLRKIEFGPKPNIPGVLPILDWAEALIGDIMPWVGYEEAHTVAARYPNAVEASGAFSPSMVFTRVPILSNYIDGGLDDLYKKIPFISNVLNKKLPTPKTDAEKQAAANLANAQFLLKNSKFKVTDLQRYGLPIQTDKFSILCGHAGEELVQIIAYLTGEIFGEGAAFVDSGFAKKVGDIVGLITGAAPGLFCTGGDPLSILVSAIKVIPIFGDAAAKAVEDWISKNLPGGLNPGGTPMPLFTAAQGADPFGEEKESWPKVIEESIAGMKVFDEAKDGNDWFAVYSSVSGVPSLIAGAQTGVQVAEWGPQSPSPIGPDDDQDKAQAEFYYDCGNTGTNGNDEGITAIGGGGTDMSPSWSECKYAAMWNMRWKVRLRRVHPFDYNIGDAIGVMLYNLTGIEGDVQKGIRIFTLGYGTETKLAGLDKLKSLFEKWTSDVLPDIHFGSSNSKMYH
jgi:hypothetical protein